MQKRKIDYCCLFLFFFFSNVPNKEYTTIYIIEKRDVLPACNKTLNCFNFEHTFACLFHYNIGILPDEDY